VTTTAPLRLANAPASWGVDFADQPGIAGWESVLDGIRAAGFSHVELGPYGYLPGDVDALRDALDARGLDAAGGLLYEPFHDPAAHREILSLADAVFAWIAGAGGEYVLLIPQVNDERTGVAGRAGSAGPLDGERLVKMVTLLEELAARARELGIVPALHPHVGTHVETREEIAAVMGSVRTPEMMLCLDTGHSLYAGIDPSELFREYRDLVAGFHLKDVATDALRSRLAAGDDFDQTVAAGVFRPLGAGDVDFIRFAAALEEAQTTWWATVEQDVDPLAPGDPVEDAAASRAYLESIGLSPVAPRATT
jgi:inosose dehydratase